MHVSCLWSHMCPNCQMGKKRGTVETRGEEQSEQLYSGTPTVLKSRDPRDSMNKPILQSVNCDDSINGGDNGHLQSLMALLALCRPSGIVRNLHQLYVCLFSLFHVVLLHAINRTL